MAPRKVSHDHSPWPLIGREDELAALQECFQLATMGKAPLVLVEGEAGIGKTALIKAFQRWALEQGARVLYAACREVEATSPFMPTANLLAQAIPQLEDAEREAISEMMRTTSWLPIVFRLQPSLADEIGWQLQERRTREFLTPGSVYESVARIVEILTERRPLVIILDNLHWADSATIQLRGEVYFRVKGRPILMVGTYRPEEIGQSHPVHQLRTRLLQADRLRLIRLPRLSVEQARRLLAWLIEGTPALPRHEPTEPWPPGMCVAYARLLIHCRSEVDAPVLFPAVIHDRLIECLSASARQVLETMTVLGLMCSVDDIRAITGLSTEALRGALEDLVTLGLVTEENGWYDLADLQFARTLYERMDEDRRRELHLKAGLHLSQRRSAIGEGAAALLARHFLAAGDSSQALEHLVEAGEWAFRVYAFDEAQALTWDALSQAVIIGDSQMQNRIHRTLGAIQERLGHHRAALEHFHAAAASARSPAQRALIRIDIARILGLLGEHEQARGALSQALEASHGLNAAAINGRIWLYLGWLEHRAGQHEQAIALLQQALNAAITAGDDLLEADAALFFGLVRWRRQSLEEARELCQRSQRIRDRIGDVLGSAHASYFLGAIEGESGHIAAAQRHLARSVEGYRRCGERLLEAAAQALWGRLCAQTDDLAEAVIHYGQALQILHEHRRLESPPELPMWTRPTFD